MCGLLDGVVAVNSSAGVALLKALTGAEKEEGEKTFVLEPLLSSSTSHSRTGLLTSLLPLYMEEAAEYTVCATSHHHRLFEARQVNVGKGPAPPSLC